jgi:CO2 hydration protein
MFWHGGGGLDQYLDSPAFQMVIQDIIAAKFRNNPFMLTLNRLFPDFLPEQIRLMSYYRGLGQFWRVMSDLFISLSDRYDQGEINSIQAVVEHILAALVENANAPFNYQVQIKDKVYDVVPESAGLTFLKDLAVPYVESIFFRGGPFPGTVSYNAQADQIPYDQSSFTYGALYADPLPIGGPGIPPTQLMQDMRHFLPPYLSEFYHNSFRQEEDLLVQICESFQKSMFCVTTAAIKGLAPFPLDTLDPQERQTNRTYLINWMNRLKDSRITVVNS